MNNKGKQAGLAIRLIQIIRWIFRQLYSFYNHQHISSLCRSPVSRFIFFRVSSTSQLRKQNFVSVLKFKKTAWLDWPKCSSKLQFPAEPQPPSFRVSTKIVQGDSKQFRRLE